MNNEFALFLGCTIPIKNLAFEKASRLVLNDLGIKLHEMDGAGCCPNPVAVQSLNAETWMALAARNISIAEEMEKDIITLCAGCFETLKVVNQLLKRNKKYRENVQKILGKAGYEYKGSINVHHFVDVLTTKEALKKIKSMVTKNLDLNVSAHYGCHLIRPSEYIQFDDPERPESIDKILKALNVNSIDSSEKLTCCGYCARLQPEIGETLSQRKVIELQKLGADCMVAACPACANQLSNSQRQFNRKHKQEPDKQQLKVPILYVTELIALVFGYTPEELNFKSRLIKADKLLEKIS
ncbi:MAG: CoB--CoM heterodisulfide reductase iron-sulfur subunit B family protein [Promethearchaeota archaeon]